ncbi:DUF397 domain-containing protein [Streptomyces sp. NPDC088733]|uniref:DUF397 domain-containing protein n=1 Tax=Streptomyces sp. NPDC088733 TaxID=3365880 RepID=UPI0037FE3F53
MGMIPEAPFKKSSFSEPDDCIEVARPATGPVWVRDSKDPHGPVLAFDRSEWAAFLADLPEQP